MRLNPSILKLMARGTMLGLVSLGASGCPGTSQQAPPRTQPGGQNTPDDPDAPPPPDAQAPDAPDAPNAQAPDAPNAQAPDAPNAQAPDAHRPGGQTPGANSGATPECGGVHANDAMTCEHCDYCPPCGRG